MIELHNFLLRCRVIITSFRQNVLVRRGKILILSSHSPITTNQQQQHHDLLSGYPDTFLFSSFYHFSLSVCRKISMEILLMLGRVENETLNISIKYSEMRFKTDNGYASDYVKRMGEINCTFKFFGDFNLYKKIVSFLMSLNVSQVVKPDFSFGIY